MKAFTIIRVSAQDQLHSYGPLNQWQDDILPNAKLLGLEVSEKYKRIIQESATGWDRPLFEAAIREAMALHQDKEIEAIIFPRQDRESRFIFGSFTLLTEVVRSGLKVFFARERFELNPKDSESVERYLNKAQQAQAYVETMKVNTARGRKARATNGKLIGGHSLYGYKYIKGKGEGEGVRYVNPEQAEWVKKMYSWLINENLSINGITKRLRSLKVPTPSGSKFWQRQTVHRILINPSYTGHTYVFTRQYIEPRRRKQRQDGTFNNGKTGIIKKPQSEWTELPNCTPRIIDDALFNAARIKLQRNKEVKFKQGKREYLLSGYVFCRHCGVRYIGYVKKWKDNGKPNEQRYYRCRNALTIDSPEICTNRQVNAPYLENEVWARINDLITNPETVLDELNKREKENEENKKLYQFWQDEIRDTEVRLKAVEKRKDDMWNALALTGDQERFKIQVGLCEADKKALIKNKSELEEKVKAFKQSQIDIENIKDICKSLKVTNTENLDYEGKRAIFESLKLRVIIDGENISIDGALMPPKLNLVSSDSQPTGQLFYPFIVSIGKNNSTKRKVLE